MTPDVINGGFELGGTLVSLLNLRAIIRDQLQLRGVSIWPTIFFLSWGLWNLVFYSSLHQPWSYFSAFGLVAVNSVWLTLVMWGRIT